jgi:hypothetical protein
MGNQPNPNPSEQKMKAAFKSFCIISYDLYFGTTICFQHVCEMGSFLVPPDAFSNVTVNF